MPSTPMPQFALITDVFSTDCNHTAAVNCQQGEDIYTTKSEHHAQDLVYMNSCTI